MSRAAEKQERPPNFRDGLLQFHLTGLRASRDVDCIPLSIGISRIIALDRSPSPLQRAFSFQYLIPKFRNPVYPSGGLFGAVEVDHIAFLAAGGERVEGLGQFGVIV